MRTTFCSYSASGLQRLQFVGGTESDQHAARTRTRNAHDHVAQFAGARIGNAGAHDDLLQSQAFGGGGKPLHDVVQFVAPQIERRPHVQEDAVPMEALLSSPARLKQADASERLREHALQVRQLHDAPCLIAHRRHIAHFGAREQPLVLWDYPEPRRAAGKHLRPTATARY